MYGHDFANSRTQSAETSLPPSRALSLVPAWKYDTGNVPGIVAYVDIDNTPAVAGGCVFLADAAGDVAALDAGDGHLIWRRHVDAPVTGTDAGTFIGSPAVQGNLVILIVNELGGPYSMALDTATGAIRWTSPKVSTDPGSYSHASPVAYKGVVFVGFSVPEGDPTAHGGFAIVDARTGALLAHTYTIPESDWAAGYAGGGIWSTPAVDTATGYAYVGAGNPFSKHIEHDRTNAILKIDLDRKRPTFGTIVASYKGQVDQSTPLITELAQPTCALFPENPPPLVQFPPFIPDPNQARDSYGCFQLDLDFGAAANLFPGLDGRLDVGELQKSGVYHVVHADDMSGVRQVPLGVSCLFCNAASTAYDPSLGAVSANISPGSFMTSFKPREGQLRWYSPVADGIHYQPVSTADGVTYNLDSSGFLDAFDSATGLPLLRRPLALDGAPDAIGALSSGGVAIANHTVYVAAGSHLIAYRPLLP